MGGGQPVHIKYFAIGGQPAVEIVAVPGCQPLLAVMRIRFGDIEPAGNDIGLANPVDTAALRHGLAERDDPGLEDTPYLGSRRLANLFEEAQLATRRHPATAATPRAARISRSAVRIPMYPNYHCTVRTPNDRQ